MHDDLSWFKSECFDLFPDYNDCMISYWFWRFQKRRIFIQDIPDRLKSYLRKARDEDKLGKIPTPLKAVHPPSSIESVASNGMS